MMYARPIITDCQLESCPVFLSSIATGNECCGKMHISNVKAILWKLSLKAGVTTRIVNTRMMRRSTISCKNKDPSFKQELSHLAGHSYETARRYYSVYDTSEQSKKIVSKLEEKRDLLNSHSELNIHTTVQTTPTQSPSQLTGTQWLPVLSTNGGNCGQ